MRLLFDQNISFRVVNSIINVFPNSSQVRLLGLENATDNIIWKFAKDHNFTIVTFDADFADIVNIKGHPPKIIWLRTGNLTTKAITKLLINHKSIIIDFISSPNYTSIACLEIDVSNKK